ncbi:MAG: acyltransferase family protein [Synechococcaceae cyanobacterium]|nr:acyltransferase family protein [Synechococcaceae cyanobacterium]
MARPGPSAPSPAPQRYRADVDGLRAVAVLAVIANHFSDRALANGFLGVDIFFVISGFVITGSFAHHRARGPLDFLLGFYSRRIQRLLPALLVYLAITAPLLCLVSSQPGASLEVGLWALPGLANIALRNASSNYFASATQLNPFTHTWSLGVEEQFYLLFPLLAWFSGFVPGRRQGRRIMAAALLLLGAASLLSFVQRYPSDLASAYYLMPSRFWELAAGALLALLLAWRPALLQRLPAALPGLLLLLVLAWPGLPGLTATLAAVPLSALLIGSLHPGDPVHALLCRPRLVGLGLLSYSLYLWHWGVLSLSRWTLGIHPWTVPFQLLAMLLLAWLSYRFVETPLRRRPWSPRRSRIVALGLGAAAAVAALLTALRQEPLQRRLFSGQGAPPAAAALPPAAPGCNVSHQGPAAAGYGPACGFPPRGRRPTLYLAGDSHIDQFRPALAALARSGGLGFRAVVGDGCMLPGTVTILPGSPCLPLQRLSQQMLLRSVQPGDRVFLGSAVYSYFSGEMYPAGRATLLSSDRGQPIRVDRAGGLYADQLRQLAEQLVARGATVVLYLDGPQFPGLGTLPGELCQRQWFRPLLLPACQRPQQPFQRQRDALLPWLHSWSDGQQRRLWDGLDRDTCSAGLCQARHYLDSNHFSPSYASRLVQRLAASQPDLFRP